MKKFVIRLANPRVSLETIEGETFKINGNVVIFEGGRDTMYFSLHNVISWYEQREYKPAEPIEPE